MTLIITGLLTGYLAVVWIVYNLQYQINALKDRVDILERLDFLFPIGTPSRERQRGGK